MRAAYLFAPLALAVFAAACATPAPKANTAMTELFVIKTDATIPFANRPETIRSWTRRADGTLLLEAGGRYYRVTLRADCATALVNTSSIGFKADPGGDFSRLSSVTTPTQECPVSAVDEVADPNMPRGS